MNSVRKHFAPALRKVPGIVAGVFDADRLDVTALGTLEHEPDPASLCWEIGSITKVFTGILLAEMSIRGEVGLNDPIGLHLPDPWPVGCRPAKGSEDPYSNLTEDNVLAHLGPKARRPRRRRSRYSNYGMGLLGQMLAGVAATPYATLIEQRLLDPLGMKATTGIGTCGEETKPVQGFRKGIPTPPWTFGALEGAGALRSTVDDLMRFVRACLDPPDGPIGEALDLARRPFYEHRLPFGDKGLGWMLRSLDRRRRRTETIWHDGGTFGASSFLAIDVPTARAIIAFGNAGPGVIPPLDGPAWAVFDGLGG